MKAYTSLAISDPKDFLFGTTPQPVTTKRGLVIGGGEVYPEINFTLPTMLITAETMGRVEEHYRQMVSGCLQRAAELEVPGVVVEFEALPPMTENPDWGMRVVDILLDHLEQAHAKWGLKGALRVTPNDTRETDRPPKMRSGALLDGMLELFERSAAAGADMLSIESVGGKELHDDALMECDLEAMVFSLCVMGERDMIFLWSKIAEIAQKHGAIAAGDTACGFSNTAMVLAEQNMIPRVVAAVDRTVSAVRSLAAYRAGAVGPGKDCGYENTILKAITGCPMSHEGRSSAGAHLSRVGNVAGSTCDLWSNESIQNVKLLSAMAPVVGMEQLAFDCRLFNTASAEGKESARTLQRWLVESDSRLDVQAYILRPDSAIAVGEAIVGAPDPYTAGRAAAARTLELIQEGLNQNRLVIPDREQPWLDMLEGALEDLPATAEEATSHVMAKADTSRFIAEDYLI